jgi:hypothetical protein
VAAEAHRSVSSPIFPCVGPRHGGTGSKRRGQIPTLVGMRWRRGSDGWASMKGGGSGVSSTRGCSRCGGEGGGERRARCGEAEARAPFIGRDGERRGQEAGGRQWSLTPPALLLKRGGESTGRPIDEGEMKGVGCRFGSAPFRCGRVTVGGMRRSSAGRADGDSGNRRWGGPPGGPTWARVDRKLGQRGKIPRKMKTACRRGLGRNANWASEWISELISRILSSNEKV